MPTFETTLPDSPVASELLGRYFSDRAATRPAALGAYRIPTPDPAQFAPPAGAFVVVRDDAGTPIGCGGVRRIAPAAEARDPEFGGDDWMEVKHLFTTPEARGLGAATGLLERLEQIAASMRADRLVLDTSTSLSTAARLYERRGFAPITPFNDNPNADTWLGKRLAA